MPQTENIVKFLQTGYSDEKLAALLAHAQDGKLAFDSCCCLIGVPTADHSLKGERGHTYDWLKWEGNISHHLEVRWNWPFAKDAEDEFHELGRNDAERRDKIIPLILAEMERREQVRQTSTASILDRKEEPVLA